MSKPTVAIVYGFAEHDWTGRYFCEQLEASGFEIIADEAAADILVSHSAGCFYLPDTGPEQLTVLIGPPYWPGKSMSWAFLQKFYLDFKAYVRRGRLLPWLDKTAHGAAYVLGGLRKAVWIARNANRHDFYVALRNKDVVIIRAEQDTFLTPAAPQLLANKAVFSFRTVPGQHDECWLDPKPYIEVIKSEYAKGR